MLLDKEQLGPRWFRWFPLAWLNIAFFLDYGCRKGMPREKEAGKAEAEAENKTKEKKISVPRLWKEETEEEAEWKPAEDSEEEKPEEMNKRMKRLPPGSGAGFGCANYRRNTRNQRSSSHRHLVTHTQGSWPGSCSQISPQKRAQQREK